MRLVHLVGHGSESGFRWHPRPGSDEGEFQDRSDFVQQIMLQRETVECMFLDGCSMREVATMLHEQGMQFVIYWDGPVSDSVCVQFSKFLYEDMFENFPRQWRELFENTCIRTRTHFAREPLSADRLGKVVLLSAADGQVQEPLSTDLISRKRTEPDTPVQTSVTSGGADEDDPSRQWAGLSYVACFSRGPESEPASGYTRLPRFRKFSQYAGEYEKESLRVLGFCVQLNGRDIGPGNGAAKAVHTLPALLVLWCADHLGNLPANCPSPFDVPSYLDLWQKKPGGNGSEVCQRSRHNLTHGTRGTQGTIITADQIRQAVLFLQEAILCRRLDMWAWEGANRAMAQYYDSPEFVADNNGQPYDPAGKLKVTNRVDKIGSIIQEHARIAFSQGLTTAAAMQIGVRAGQAARASFAAQPLNGNAAKVRGDQQAEADIAAALATGVEPAGQLRLPMPDGALLRTGVWNDFVASAGPLDPGHVDIHDALCSCLSELTTEYGHLL